MTNDEIIQQTAEFIKKESLHDSSGHDWQHIVRVWNTARRLCAHEAADEFIVQLAALLHDLDDWKFNAAQDESPHRAQAWLESCHLDAATIKRVCEIIRDVSYKGAASHHKMQSIEGQIAQDADRLDAIGAIGIARAFAYGGYKQRTLYDPDIPPQMHNDFDEYKRSQSSTINHFYEKLLLLKDQMNTPTAKTIAAQRHQVLLDFLDQFMREWNGDLRDE